MPMSDFAGGCRAAHRIEPRFDHVPRLDASRSVPARPASRASVRRGFEWLPALCISVVLHAAAAAWIDHSAPMLDRQPPVVKPIRISLGVMSPSGSELLASDAAADPAGELPMQRPAAEDLAHGEEGRQSGDAAHPARGGSTPGGPAGADGADPAVAAADSPDSIDAGPVDQAASVPDLPRPIRAAQSGLDHAVAGSGEPASDAVRAVYTGMHLIAASASTPASNAEAEAGAAQGAPVSSAVGPGARASRAAGAARHGRRAEYARAIQSWLSGYRKYPHQARQRGQQGTARLYFVLDRDGRVIESRVDESSGFGLLDAEALAMVDRAQPFPPLPEGLALSRLELVVPVQFHLR